MRVDSSRVCLSDIAETQTAAASREKKRGNMSARKAKIPHPFRWDTPSALWSVTNLSSVLVAFSAAGAAAPSVLTRLSDVIPGGIFANRIAFGALGLINGLVVYHALHSLRRRILTSLFTYLEWVQKPNSFKTKVSLYYSVQW